MRVIGVHIIMTILDTWVIAAADPVVGICREERVS